MSEARDLEINLQKEPVSKPAEATEMQEGEKSSLDTLLVFGQGPVIDSTTREYAEGTAKKGMPVSEDVNFWSDNIAKAAAELYLRKQTKEIVVMGGPTGGAQYDSEAGLIGKKLEKLGVPSSAIRLEKTSTNTLLNVVNLLNENPQLVGADKSIGILGSDYHIGRIRVLMDMFDIPIGKNVFPQRRF